MLVYIGPSLTRLTFSSYYVAHILWEIKLNVAARALLNVVTQLCHTIEINKISKEVHSEGCVLLLLQFLTIVW